MRSLALLYWPLACLLLASAQGLLLPAIKRTPPGAEARRQSVALHGLLTVVYFVPLGLLLIAYNSQLIATSCIAAVGCRLLLFDPVLNLAAGDEAFAVGQTAWSDKMLRYVAARVSWQPERLRVVVWVLSVGAACCLLIVNC